MVRCRIGHWAVVAAIFGAPCGCGETAIDLVVADDGGADSDADTDTDSEGDSVKARILVGNDFPDSPVCLTANFFEEPWPEGEPDGMGAMIPFPDIKKPEDDEPPYILKFTQPALEGPYFLFVTALFHDTCSADPIEALDWTGRSDNPVLLGPGTGEVDAHDIDLQHPPL